MINANETDSCAEINRAASKTRNHSLAALGFALRRQEAAIKRSGDAFVLQIRLSTPFLERGLSGRSSGLFTTGISR
jgi:hypothetical protein